MYVCMYVCKYVSFYLSTYLSVNQSIYLSIYASIYLCIHLSIHTNVHLTPGIYGSLWPSSGTYLGGGCSRAGSFTRYLELPWPSLVVAAETVATRLVQVGVVLRSRRPTSTWKPKEDLAGWGLSRGVWAEA